MTGTPARQAPGMIPSAGQGYRLRRPLRVPGRSGVPAGQV